MSLAETLAQAEHFIAGFEDDDSQEGVRELLQRLRHHQKDCHHPCLSPTPAPKYSRGEASASNYAGTFYTRIFHSDRAQQIGRWVGNEGMNDQLGRSWERFFFAVIDDFGNLVEVPA